MNFNHSASNKTIKGNVKKPAEVFNSCPQCDSKNITKFEEQVFCECGWCSVYVYEELVSLSASRQKGNSSLMTPPYCSEVKIIHPDQHIQKKGSA